LFASGTAIVTSGSEAIIHTTCRQQVRLFIKFPWGRGAVALWLMNIRARALSTLILIRTRPVYIVESP
jgi:hypothetical protein